MYPELISIINKGTSYVSPANHQKKYVDATITSK